MGHLLELKVVNPKLSALTITTSEEIDQKLTRIAMVKI